MKQVKKAKKMSEKKFEYCKICKKKLAERILSPDGEGGFQSSLRHVTDDKYNIYQAVNGGFVFTCWDCEPSDEAETK